MSGVTDLPKTLTISEHELNIRSFQQGQREDTGRVLLPVLTWVWLCQSLCHCGKGSRSKISCQLSDWLSVWCGKKMKNHSLIWRNWWLYWWHSCQHFFSVIYSSTFIKCQMCRRWVNGFRIPLLNCFIFSYCCHSTTILVSIQGTSWYSNLHL